MSRPLAWAGLALVLVPVIIGLATVISRIFVATATGDPGRLEEPLYEWTADDGPLPILRDVTTEWGFGEWRDTSVRQASGGVAIADVDGDGALDLIVAGGGAAVYFNEGPGQFVAAEGSFPGERGVFTSVGTGDVDGDGGLDILVGNAFGDDLVVWGGAWAAARDQARAEVTFLPGGEPTTALIVADLTADGRGDVLRLGYGGAQPSTDIIFAGSGDRREFSATSLPGSDRRSFAAQLADIDGDGLIDIWVTRDVGWRDGANSVYSRRGAADGPWVDIAAEIGAALAIDGMGVTLADLTGNGELDAYLSDLGENDILGRSGAVFAPLAGTGAGRIRPSGAPPDVISSSWASGATDINLDGILDLVVVNGGFVDSAPVNKVRGTDISTVDPPAVLLGTPAGEFADVWQQLGLEWTQVGRGLAIGDLDGDGDSDLVVASHHGSLRVLRNDTPGGSVTVEYASAACRNRGAVVVVDGKGTRFTSLLAAGSFLGVHAPQAVVGVPADAVVAVTGLDGSVLRTAAHAGRQRVTVACPAP